jgi:plastocyanin
MVAEGGGHGQGWRWPALAFAVTCVIGADAFAAPQTHTVVIEGMRFTPATLTVHRGDRIVWRNKDLVPHTATADKIFDSHGIPADGSWTYVAAKAGTLPYACSLHPSMKATLEVQ